jgi:calcium uptake protein 1, mitochondrial
LEKIFDYFSTQEQDGIKHMAPADLLRSIVATYPAYGSTAVRGGHLSGRHFID